MGIDMPSSICRRLPPPLPNLEHPPSTPLWQCPDGIFAALAVHLAHRERGISVDWRPNTVYTPLSVADLALQVRGFVCSRLLVLPHKSTFTTVTIGPTRAVASHDDSIVSHQMLRMRASAPRLGVGPRKPGAACPGSSPSRPAMAPLPQGSETVYLNDFSGGPGFARQLAQAAGRVVVSAWGAG